MPLTVTQSGVPSPHVATLKADDDSTVVVWRNVALTIWKSDIDENGLMATWQAGEHISAAGERPINLTILEEGLRLDASTLDRKRLLVQTMMRSAPSSSSEALVFLTEGFVGSTLRSMYTGLLEFRRFGNRESFSDVEEAIEWTADVNNLTDAFVEDLYEVLAEVRGEKTGVRLKLADYGY